MAKIITKLPEPTDAQGNLLSAEEIEQLAQEPTYVRVEIERNGRKVFYTVAADFDRVTKEADQAYQLFKAQQYKIYAGEKKSPRNSKLTNLREGDDETDEDDDSLTGEQNMKLVELNPQQRAVFTELVLPSIMGGNVPALPERGANNPETRQWFDGGGQTSTAVLEALVMAYDPTGPLAQGKMARERVAELTRQVEEKLQAQMEKLGTDSDATDKAPEAKTPKAKASTRAKAEPESQPDPEPQAMEPISSSVPLLPVGDAEPAAASGA